MKHRDSSDTALANYTYTYDLADRVTSEVRNGSGISYSNDETDQLTNDSYTTYTYDLNGNRTMTGYATGTGNRMTSDGVYTYTYDAEGNMIKKSKGLLDETWTFSYDHDNHLVTAEKRTTDGGLLQMQATYTYDAVRQRIQSVVDADGIGLGAAVTSRFAFDLGKGQLSDAWADLDGISSLTSRRIYGDGVDQPLSRLIGTTVVYFLTDRLGSVRELANNSTGAFIYEVSYNGFGKVLSEVNPTNRDRIGFAGYWFLAEVGLSGVRARMYDAATGRWLQQDPSGLGDDDNPYGYVKNNPVMYVDPTGLWHEADLARARRRVVDLRGRFNTVPTFAEQDELRPQLAEALAEYDRLRQIQHDPEPPAGGGGFPPGFPGFGPFLHADDTRWPARSRCRPQELLRLRSHLEWLAGRHVVLAVSDLGPVDLCPRRWLTAYLTACAEAGGQLPANWQTFLPWRLTQAHYDAWADPTGPPTANAAPTGPPPDCQR